MLPTLISYFDTAEKGENYNGMLKLDVDRTHPLMIQVIQEFRPDGYEFARGNFFEHLRPYYPHVDGYEDELNVLLPLRLRMARTQRFIVFDQTFPRPATWSMNPRLQEFKINKLRRCAPAEDAEVVGLTGKPCDIAGDLPGDPAFWFGLSGVSHKWVPGLPIVFNSNHLHASGRQLAPKLGLTMIYKRIP